MWMESNECIHNESTQPQIVLDIHSRAVLLAQYTKVTSLFWHRVSFKKESLINQVVGLPSTGILYLQWLRKGR